MSSDCLCCCKTRSAFWRNSELYQQVEANHRQETASDPTPRPQHSLHRSPYDDTISAAAKNQAIHQADPTSNNDSCVPRHGLSDADLSPSGYPGSPLQVYQSVTQHDRKCDVAGLQSHSGYPSDNDSDSWVEGVVQEFQFGDAGDRTTNNYQQAPRNDPRDDTLRSPPSVCRGIIQRDTQSAKESPTNSVPSTAFHNTFPGSFSHPVQETPQGGTTPGVTQHRATFLTANDHPVPANDQACGWDDGNGPCGIHVHKNRIAEHMTSSFHVLSHLSAKSAVKCRWKGCKRKETLRRDTIFRHILEKHYGIRRPKPGKKRAMSH